jgi:beta-glucosidase
LLAHFPGQEGARAAVDILTGFVSPSGRLATTWWRGLEDVPSFEHFPAKRLDDGSVAIRYAEGLRVGYRAVDEDTKERVLWPLGHGLSYTRFEYAGLRVAKTLRERTLKVAVEVKNVGEVGGKEVVQVYVCPLGVTTVWRPRREVKGFTKIDLQPEEQREVELEIDLKMACSYWDEEVKAWRLERAEYGVEVGGEMVKFQVEEGCTWTGL